MEYKAHRIEPPSPHVTTSKAELMQFFETMYRMRRMEIAADMMYKAKFIRGFCHLCAPRCWRLAARHVCRRLSSRGTRARGCQAALVVSGPRLPASVLRAALQV